VYYTREQGRVKRLDDLTSHLKIFALLGCYTGYIDSYLFTFWENLSVPSWQYLTTKLCCITQIIQYNEKHQYWNDTYNWKWKQESYLFITATTNILYHYRCCTLPHSVQCQATNSELHLCTYIILSPTYAMLYFHCTPVMARGWENCRAWQQRSRFCFTIKPTVNHVTELLSNIKSWILQCNSTEWHLQELNSICQNTENHCSRTIHSYLQVTRRNHIG
jgi:hypothetical protein